MPDSSVGAVAERVVLGALLDGDNSEFIHDTMSWLTPSAFESTAHQKVFQAVADLYLDGVPIGLESVRARMSSNDTITAVGGYPGLTDLTHAVLTEPSSAPRTYLAALADAFQARSAANELRSLAERLGNDVSFDDARTRTEELFANGSHMSAALPDLEEQIAQFRLNLQTEIDRGPGLHGIPTGYVDLDGNGDPNGRRPIIGGLRPPWLVYIAARPSVGKSVVLIDWIRAACKAGYGVYFASTEMTANEVLQRLLVAECATVRLDTLTKTPDQLTPLHLEQLENAEMQVMAWNLVIDDMASTMPAIERGAAGARAKFRSIGSDLHVIFQDYIQMLGDPPALPPSNSEYARVSANSTRAKLLAKRMNVPFVAAVQVSREATDREPRLDDLKSSGQLEQDADAVLALERKYATNPAGAAEHGYLPEDMRVFVLKYRHGAAGQSFPRNMLGERACTVEAGNFPNRSLLQNDDPRPPPAPTAATHGSSERNDTPRPETPPDPPSNWS